MNESLVLRIARRTMSWKFRLWSFGEAVALRGLLRAGSVVDIPEAHGYVRGLLNAYLGCGVGKMAEEHAAPGRELITFYQQTGESEYLDAARKLGALHTRFPTNRYGARLHCPDRPGSRGQIWVDCMDVDGPFLVRLGLATEQPEYIAQGAEQVAAYARLLQDSKTGLFYHGFEEACGPNGQLWARGNGWAMMGMVETAILLPPDSTYREELLERLQKQCRALNACQDPSGLWHTIVDCSDTYLESTLAAMAAFALREAFGAGVLKEDDFGEMERKARTATMSLIKEDGALDLVSDATPIGEYKTYATRPFGIFPWGQGPLLLMISQTNLKELRG